MAWVAVAVVGTSALSAGISAATQPDAPDYSKLQREGIEADIDTLPIRRKIEAAAKAGTKITVPDPNGGTPLYANVKVVPIAGSQGGGSFGGKGDVSGFGQAFSDPKTGKLYQANQVKKAADGSYYVEGAQIGTTPGTKTIDFTGLGEADLAAINADKLAKTALDLSKKYGSEIIAERLKELQQADPEGFAGRKQMYQMIQDQIARQPDTKTAQLLSDQLFSDLEQGAALSPDVQREVEQDILRQQAKRGNLMGNAPMVEEAMTVGSAGEKRKSERQQKALAFLTSGATPDDIDYRKFQQDIANLGSFVNGQTPTSQFGQLSGAQAGAVPFNTGNTNLPGLNPDAGNQATNFGMNLYNSQVSQPNPYLQSLGVGLAAGNLALSATKTPKLPATQAGVL